VSKDVSTATIRAISLRAAPSAIRTKKLARARQRADQIQSGQIHRGREDQKERAGSDRGQERTDRFDRYFPDRLD
jgi:hypothetical protein